MPQKTNPSRQFDYFFRENPEVLAELKTLGIRFDAVDVGGGEYWPALITPKGAVLLVAMDDEGNGPGAIHISEAA